MSFPHAEKGIKTLIVAEVFAIVSAVLFGIPSVLLNVFTMLRLDLDAIKESALWIVVYAFSSLISVAAMVVMLILSLIGYYQASKDEKEFKKAMFCALVYAGLTLFGSFFYITNSTITTIFNAAGSIFEMFVLVYAVTAMNSLAEQCERPDMLKRGKSLLIFILITYIVAALNAIVIRIFELSDKSIVVAIVVGVIDLILNVTQLLLYLRYLKKTAKMLAGAQ